MSATITYKGETVETLNGGEYVALHTKGMTMEDDIRVEVSGSTGGSGGLVLASVKPSITIATDVPVGSITAAVEVDLDNISDLSVTEGE